jgi:hypothetical protein
LNLLFADRSPLDGTGAAASVLQAIAGGHDRPALRSQSFIPHARWLQNRLCFTIDCRRAAQPLGASDGFTKDVVMGLRAALVSDPRGRQFITDPD